MTRFLFLALFLISCSQSKSVKETVQSVDSGLLAAGTYHEFMDNTAEPEAKKLIEAYNKNPKTLCEEILALDSKELISLREVLELTKDEIVCANAALLKIENFYSTFRSMSLPLVNLKSNLKSSVVILDQEYSIPGENKLASRVLNFTFDDGPHNENTMKVLNTLDSYEIKANFFVMGKNAKNLPRLVQETARRGHSVGGHSMSHRDLAKIGYQNAVNEINGVFDVIESILGGADPFFRFPYGSRTKSLRAYLAQNNISDFFWSVDTLDWKYKNPDYLLKYALNQTTGTGSGIVLFHDIQPQTAAILPAYFARLNELKYSSIVYEPK